MMIDDDLCKAIKGVLRRPLFNFTRKWRKIVR